MKRLISIILTFTVLLLSLSCIAFAENSAEISIQDESVYAGDEFTVNVFISDNSQLSGAVIDVNYDDEMLEFVSAKEGGILDTKANISLRHLKNDNSYVRFTYMSASSSILTKGILFSITFKVKETAKDKTELKITVPNAADFVNSNLEKIPYTVDNSEITILNNISIEPSIEESTNESLVEIESTENIQSETITDEIVEDNDKKDGNDILLMIVLLLIGVALICFGVVLAIKKNKK